VKKLLILTFALMVAPGCAVSKLRRSSSRVGITVDDVITQQVLDNLAKFKQNPNSIPHFAYPAGAQSSVRDSVGATPATNFSRWTLLGWGSGFGFGLDDSEGFTMQPVTDPYKLDLMRCLYQQAVCNTSAECPDCEKRYNKFYFGTEEAPQVIKRTPRGHRVYWWSGERIKETANSKTLDDLELSGTKSIEYLAAIRNEFGEDEFYTCDGVKCVLKDEDEIAALLALNKLRPVYVDDSLAQFSQRTGRITPACLSCGWVRCGDPDGIKNSRCCATGEYCGVEIWVPANCRDQLSILTLLVLEIARHDPAVIAPESKPEQHELLLTFANLPGMTTETGSAGEDDPSQTKSTFILPHQQERDWRNVRPRGIEKQAPMLVNPLSGNSNAVESILNERARETLVR